MPIAIVGQNGAGKSLTLSVVLDAMTEARRSSFSSIQEVNNNQYIKVSSKNYIQNSKQYSHASVKLSTANGEVSYDELVSQMHFDEFAKENPIPELLPALQGNDFRNSGFYKNISIGEQQKKQ